MTMNHDLKIDEEYFNDVKKGLKKFEIRFNDRNYRVGDTINLFEITRERKYTGRKVSGVITYITDYEQKTGYIVFGFSLLED